MRGQGDGALAPVTERTPVPAARTGECLGHPLVRGIEGTAAAINHGGGGTRSAVVDD
jgi:hypothetical protein